MIDNNQLDQVVRAQINDILEANWVDVCSICTNIAPEKVNNMLTVGMRPGIDMLTCSKCGRSGVLVCRNEIWDLV